MLFGANRLSHVGFRLTYFQLTLAYFNGQSQLNVAHIWTVNIFEMADRVYITIDINYEIEYGPSISVFKFDLVLFQMSA